MMLFGSANAILHLVAESCTRDANAFDYLVLLPLYMKKEMAPFFMSSRVFQRPSHDLPFPRIPSIGLVHDRLHCFCT